MSAAISLRLPVIVKREVSSENTSELERNRRELPVFAPDDIEAIAHFIMRKLDLS